MNYYYNSKLIEGTLDEVYLRVKDVLKEYGFGIISEIDVQKTMKEKLDVEFRDYLILGACNPPNAFRALNLEDRIGLLLPCNVIVQSRGEGKYEVSAVDPAVSMQMIENPELGSVAGEVRTKLFAAIDSL